jgi:phosphohistidine phosphatase
MAVLLVMRHAKSDWSAAFEDDHERPLAPRGVKAAMRMGRFLTDSGLAPGLVLTSTAVRAIRTAELAVEAGGWTCPISSTSVFYGADPGAVVSEVVDRDPPDRLLIVGHEPTWSELVSVLIGGGGIRMPTAAIACVEFGEGPWRDALSSRGRLRWLITPRLLKGMG